MKIRIIFNTSNIESMLATNIVINHLKKDDEANHYNIETVGHTHGFVTNTKEVDWTFCIGANLTNMEILEEAEAATNYHHIVSKGGHAFAELLQDKGLVFSSDFVDGDSIVEEDKMFSPSLAKLTKQVLKKYFTSSFGEEPVDIVGQPKDFHPVPKTPETRMMNAVERFCWMENPSIHDIFNVHNNLDRIVQGAFSGTGCEYDLKERDADFNSNTARTTLVRNIIKKSLAGHIYGKAGNSYVVQTINCSEEYLHDIVRMVSYAYVSVIVYNDVKHHRQWWVYAKDPEVMEKIANTIPFHEKHYDGKFIYLISDMPKLSDK